jgi:L-ascorbate metabolism protein UlaG (beta-lactamase superfamily)
MVLRYIGHGMVLIELDGVRLLTGPLPRTGVAHLRRAVPLDTPAVAPVAVLISHGHYDHLDLRSLRLLGGGKRVVVPRSLAGRLARFESRSRGRRAQSRAATRTGTTG